MGHVASRGEVERELASYLSGVYGACLREVTPETIFRKERLVNLLTAALAAPRPLDPHWRARLRADVNALDAIERPFAPCDRARFGGPVSRDRLITAPRALFAGVFDEDASEGHTSTGSESCGPTPTSPPSHP